MSVGRWVLARGLAPGLRLPLALALVGAACSAPGRVPDVPEQPDYPGLLRSPDALALDVLLHQRVTASWGEAAPRGFDAALQKHGDELVLVGLSPMGAPGFSVVQRGLEVELRNDSGEDLPFPPRFILLDVQRVFFPWLAADVHRADGEYAGIVADERVVEIVRGGRLVERRFTRTAGTPAGTITVRYEWLASGPGGDPAVPVGGAGASPPWAPPRAVLENGWYGYRLTIDTHAETLLSSPTGSVEIAPSRRVARQVPPRSSLRADPAEHRAP